MGTFCAFDQQSFDVFIDHTMAECLDMTCPIDSCEQCQANTDMFGKSLFYRPLCAIPIWLKNQLIIRVYGNRCIVLTDIIY